jgi:NAD(P)-dependent dehydrogenase (short-subunit alcohol dehydrogenase family)
MKDLAGRTAFVTGAASGIGLGVATALSQAGVKVMLCDIEEEALAKAISGLKLTNADVDGVRADVSLKAELQAAADATVARYGRVHILVNNAGVGGGGGYGRWTDASWNWVLGVNLMSVIWGIEIFGPLIEAHGEGGTDRFHCIRRWTDFRSRSCVQRDQIWCRGPIRGHACDPCASGDRGIRSVSGHYSDANHEFTAQSP